MLSINREVGDGIRRGCCIDEISFQKQTNRKTRLRRKGYCEVNLTYLQSSMLQDWQNYVSQPGSQQRK